MVAVDLQQIDAIKMLIEQKAPLTNKANPKCSVVLSLATGSYHSANPILKLTHKIPKNEYVTLHDQKLNTEIIDMISIYSDKSNVKECNQ